MIKAFPTVTGATGMELRDYFAGAVIASIASSGIARDEDAEIMAKVAYIIADAMMKERIK